MVTKQGDISFTWLDNMTRAKIETDAKTAIKMLASDDMYEALKELREWIKSEDVQLLGKGLTEQFGIPKTMEKADKALAKADGK